LSIRWSRTCRSNIDSHKDQSVRRALAPLYRLAVAADIAIIALLHLNKTSGLAPLARLSGSGGFGNAARSVLLLDRDPGDPENEQGRRRILAHIKCNLAPLAPSLLYEIEPILLDATDTAPAAETSRITLIGEIDLSAEAILNQGGEEERTAREEAEAFLLDYLADGAHHPAAEIYKEAAKLRIADHALKRARKKIGAKTEKAGFSRGWEWWLSAKSPVPDSLSPSSPSSPSQPPEENEENEENRDMTTEPLDDVGPFDDPDDGPSWTEWEKALQRLQQREGIRMRTFDEVHAEIERMHAELVVADLGVSGEPPPWDDNEAADLADPDAYAFVTPIDDLDDAA